MRRRGVAGAAREALSRRQGVCAHQGGGVSPVFSSSHSGEAFPRGWTVMKEVA